MELRRPRFGRDQLDAQRLDFRGGSRRGARGTQLTPQPVALGTRRTLRRPQRFLRMLHLAGEQPVHAIDAAAEYEHEDQHQSGEPANLPPRVVPDLLANRLHERRRALRFG